MEVKQAEEVIRQDRKWEDDYLEEYTRAVSTIIRAVKEGYELYKPEKITTMEVKK